MLVSRVEVVAARGAMHRVQKYGTQCFRRDASVTVVLFMVHISLQRALSPLASGIPYFQGYSASAFEVILYKAYPIRPPMMGATINTQRLVSDVATPRHSEG